ncbi:hypothetical protein P3T23_004546 [Paraburkholderia sp. GAS448]|uniref:hypothetical protein n=1 Tax=Paraburkholderia sp. GAS448 TaxID=3035136 RepID=UPI003D1D4103
MKLSCTSLMLCLAVLSSSARALSPAPPLCLSDYRQAAKREWLAALDAVDRATPQLPDILITELEQEEAPLDRPRLLGEKKAEELARALWHQPDYVAWQIRKQTTSLRDYPAEIDRVGPDRPVGERFNAMDDGLSMLMELYRDVFSLGFMEGGIDRRLDRRNALRAIDRAARSLTGIARCDTAKALENRN